MLYDLDPDRSLTGGAWYSDQDFESEFVDVLNQQCFNFLEAKKQTAKEAVGGPLTMNNNSYASVTDVWKFINQLGISRVSALVYFFYDCLNCIEVFQMYFVLLL